MELFGKLFGRLLVFVYCCFDRVVIHGYLALGSTAVPTQSGLTEQAYKRPITREPWASASQIFEG
jgi:hypothetical protein